MTFLRASYTIVLLVMVLISGCKKEPLLEPKALNLPPPSLSTISDSTESLTKSSDSTTTNPIASSTSNRTMAPAIRIQYGNISSRQHFDFYSASGDTSLKPFVMLIHGGAWVLGPETNTYESIFKTNAPLPMKNLTQRLIDNGFAVGIMKYRLAKYYKRGAYPTNIPFPQSAIANIMTDIDSAIKTVVNNSATLKVDINRIGLLGESAGGLNALLFAYSTFPSKAYVKNVVSFYAPTDMSKTDASKAFYTYQTGFMAPKLFSINTNVFFSFDNPSAIDEDSNPSTASMYFLSAFDSLTGQFINSQTSSIRRNYSPVAYVNPTVAASAPQTFALHGSLDSVVNPNQLGVLQSALGAKTFNNELVNNSSSARHLTLNLGGFEHGWASLSFDQAANFDQTVGSRVIAWLNARLRDGR